MTFKHFIILAVACSCVSTTMANEADQTLIEYTEVAIEEVIEDFIEDNIIEDDVIEDDVIEDDFIEDDFIEDEVIEDIVIEDDIIEEDFIEEDFIEEDFIEDVIIEDDIIEQDSIDDVTEEPIEIDLDIQLSNTIEYAKQYLNTSSEQYIPLSIVNGDDYSTEQLWINHSAQITLSRAIVTAQTQLELIISTSLINDATIQSCIDTLNEAIDTFIMAAQYGNGLSQDMLALLHDKIKQAYGLIDYTTDDDFSIRLSTLNGVDTSQNWIDENIYNAYIIAIEIAIDAYEDGCNGTISAAEIAAAETALDSIMNAVIAQSKVGTGTSVSSARNNLNVAIETAVSSLLSASASDKNGTDIDFGEAWVLFDVYNTFANAIEVASDVSNTSAASAAELTSAQFNLEIAEIIYLANICTQSSPLASQAEIEQLQQLVVDAKSLMNTTFKTSAAGDGSDVSSDYRWTTSVKYAAFISNYNNANIVANKDYPTANEVATASSALWSSYEFHNNSGSLN